MKNLLLATACAVATLAAAPAFAQPTGYVGASLGYAEADFAGTEVDGESYGVHGALDFDLNDALSAQFSGSYSDAKDTDGVLTGTAHLVSNLEGGRIAGFVGAADIEDATMYAYGLQGDINMERNTIALGAAFATIDDADVDFWALTAENRFFVNDNFRIDAGLGWVDGDFGGTEANAWNANLGAEYQFNENISAFGAYTHLDIDDADTDVDAITIGVRFNFGGSLKDRDRSGASFGGIDRLAGLLP